MTAPGPNNCATSCALNIEHISKAICGEGSAVQVIDAGPLCVNDTDNTNIASFMIIEANCKADVISFHDNDPFTKADLYQRVDIERWDQHFANGKKLI